MEIQEAIKTIRALADGVHPDTGEGLTDENICRAPQIVKALNRALAALVSQEERERNRPANAGRYWSRAEEEQVCEELRQGTDFKEIARIHNRTVPSIVARLVKLGKVAAKSSDHLFPPKAPPKNPSIPTVPVLAAAATESSAQPSKSD